LSSKKSRLTALIFIGIAAVLITVDRLTKMWVVANVGYRTRISGIRIGGTELVDITHIHNDGAAFGILSGMQTLLITITSVFLVAALVVLFSGKVKCRWIMTSISLIIAGGVGNLIDRVAQGYVVDFIELRFINFAIFNFADICAVVGAFLLLFVVVIDEIKTFKARKSDEQLTIDNGQLTVNETENDD